MTSVAAEIYPMLLSESEISNTTLLLNVTCRIKFSQIRNLSEKSTKTPLVLYYDVTFCDIFYGFQRLIKIFSPLVNYLRAEIRNNGPSIHALNTIRHLLINYHLSETNSVNE